MIVDSLWLLSQYGPWIWYACCSEILTSCLNDFSGKVTSALFNTLHSQEYVGMGKRDGWSREKFFLVSFAAGTVYCESNTVLPLFHCWVNSSLPKDFFPGYIFTALSMFTWVCWITPNNRKFFIWIPVAFTDYRDSISHSCECESYQGTNSVSLTGALELRPSINSSVTLAAWGETDFLGYR